MKVRDLIRLSMLNIGVLAEGEDPGASQLQDAVTTLSMMIDTWSTERLFVSKVAQETFSFVGGQQLYTMGPGGDFDTQRPLFIESVAVRITYNTPQQVDIPCPILNQDQWARLSVKNTQGVFPTRVYASFDDTNVSLYFWPVPTTAPQVYITSWKPLVDLNTADLDISLPPGFKEALMYNLALRLAPTYGKEPSGMVVGLAQSTKSKLKASISAQKSYLMRADDALLPPDKVFNYLTGE